MSVLVLVEMDVLGQGEAGLSVVAEETLTFARGLPGEGVDAVLVGQVGPPGESCWHSVASRGYAPSSSARMRSWSATRRAPGPASSTPLCR